MNNQEAFDTALAHLRKQGQRAVISGTSLCRYRTEDGLKCAIGALIPDDRYDPYLDRESLTAASNSVLEAAGLSHAQRQFARNLQVDLHDRLDDFANLESAAMNFAQEYELEYKP